MACLNNGGTVFVENKWDISEVTKFRRLISISLLLTLKVPVVGKADLRDRFSKGGMSIFLKSFSEPKCNAMP